MILEILKAELPFIIALTLCVVANTIVGAIKHEKQDEFDWKQLLVGAVRYLVVVLAICMLVVALNIYEPLAIKFETELKALEQLITIAAFAKVIIQIKDYFGVKDTEPTEITNNDVDNYMR